MNKNDPAYCRNGREVPPSTEEPLAEAFCVQTLNADT